MENEIKKARDWYWWLWISPLLTIPTLVVAGLWDPVSGLLCSGPGRCDSSLEDQISLFIAVVISSLWHLLLLIPIGQKSRLFLNWHGFQCLSLAGMRTAVVLVFVVAFGFNWPTLLAIPIILWIYFLGTFVGYYQADRGKCSLAKWVGRGDELAGYATLKSKPTLKRKAGKVTTVKGDPIFWVNIIQFSKDPEKRNLALEALEVIDMVEEF